MRNIAAVGALITAIAGMLVIIVWGASTAYLTLSEDEPGLYDSLLFGSVAPAGWSGSKVGGIDFDEQLVTPCLKTPLLEGKKIDRRSAALYSDSSSGTAAVQMLAIQTPPGDARAIMDDVHRDTENDCQRGLIVGTIERASVDTLTESTADDGVVVNYDRLNGANVRHESIIVLREANIIAQLSYSGDLFSAGQESQFESLAESIATQIENPPSTADLFAAGVLTDPTTFEKYVQDAHDEATSILSLSSQFPVGLGLTAVGAIVLLLYILGARLTRFGTPSRTLQPASRIVASNPGPPDITPSLITGTRQHPIAETVESDEPPPEETSAAPPPVIDFPQKSIEEKLKILKEARLKEPEHGRRTVHQATPDVDWTEEISKPDSPKESAVDIERSEAASRKAILKKLRSRAPEAM